MWKENSPMPLWKAIIVWTITVAIIAGSLLATGFRVATGPTAVAELVFYTKIETAAIFYLGIILTVYVARRRD